MAALTEMQIRKALTKLYGSFAGFRDLSSYEALAATAVGHSKEEKESGVKAVPIPTEEDLRSALGNEDEMTQPRLEAIKILADMANDASAQIDAAVPRGEMAAWPVKEASARAFKAGNPESQDHVVLEAEAAMTGESIDELVNAIIAKSEKYRLISGKLAGFRRAYGEKIAKAKSPKEVSQILADAHQSADRELSKVISGL